VLSAADPAAEYSDRLYLIRIAMKYGWTVAWRKTKPHSFNDTFSYYSVTDFRHEA